MTAFLTVLNTDQITNHYAALEMALPRLTHDYVGKTMHIHKSASGNGQVYKILGFRIVPVASDGDRLSHINGLGDILKQRGIADLVIMVVFADHKGAEHLAEIHNFLEANDIKKL